jgi:hypothetical protein
VVHSPSQGLLHDGFLSLKIDIKGLLMVSSNRVILSEAEGSKTLAGKLPATSGASTGLILPGI